MVPATGHDLVGVSVSMRVSVSVSVNVSVHVNVSTAHMVGAWKL